MDIEKQKHNPEFETEIDTIKKRWDEIMREILESHLGKKVAVDLQPENIAYELERITKPEIEKKSGQIDFIILAAPTGGGKSTIGKELERTTGIVRIPRHITRPPRPNEIEGKDNYFITMEEFQRKEQNGEFIQSGYTFGEGRGTDKKTFFDLIKNKQKFYFTGSTRTPLDFRNKPDLKDVNFVSICILPPSFDVLMKRLLKRVEQDQDMTDKYIIERLKTTLKQLEQAKKTIDVFYVNDDYMRVVKEITQHL